MKRSPLLSILLLVLVPSLASAVTPLTTVRVASGLARPVFVTAPPGDTSRVFIAEQRGADAKGRIKILRNGSVLPTPFLTTSTLATGSEQGLLGLAFAPDYATTGRFYVYYTDSTWAARLVRYTVSGNPDVANPAGTTILSIPDPYNNHNGGWIAFGPDGYLYVATGDGGNFGDPQDRAQNVDSLLGKILRLDVSGSGYTSPPGNPYVGVPGLDELWAIGLRNPWRPCFDRETGDLIIADVGQNEIEEINGPTKAAGVNYGWRCWEGLNSFTSSSTTPCTSCSSPPGCMVFPVHQYPHTLSRCSITGGYVYRGCAIPDLKGQYFFGDYCGRQIYSGRFEPDTLIAQDRTLELAPVGFTIGNILSFGEDARGELYICDQSGQVFKIVPAAPVLESDMPTFRRGTALTDTLGSTWLGNALAPGITAFAAPGSRIRGVGYLKSSQLRDCNQVAAGCLTGRARLGSFDIDLRACVDSVNSTLTRRFIFTNRSGGALPLAYVDVLAPQLQGQPNAARKTAPAGGGTSAVLVQAAAIAPSRWIVHSGTGSVGVTYSADVDTASELESRVAGDLPLAEGSSTGAGTVAMALGFDFGSVSPASPETVTVVTRLQGAAPSGVDLEDSSPSRAGLRILSRIPFRSELRMELALRRSGPVSLDVFDVSGRRVRALRQGVQGAGRSILTWDGTLESGRAAPSGVYFIQLRTEEGPLRRRVVLLR